MKITSLLLTCVLLAVAACKSVEQSEALSSYVGTERIKNYQNTNTCPASDVYAPRTAGEAAEVVASAIASGKTIMTGTRGFKSQIDAACASEGQIQVTTENLKAVSIDVDSLTAKAGAGVTLADLNESLTKVGLSINMISEGGFFSVGGMLGSGTHGSTLRQGASLEEYVTAVTIIDGKGEIKEIDNAEDLKSLRVNLGVLGILVDATFKVEPLKKVKATLVNGSDANFAEDVLKLARENYSVSASWFPGISKYAATVYNFVPNDTPGDALNAQAHITEPLLNAYRVMLPIAYGDRTGGISCGLSNTRFGLRSNTFFTENGKKQDNPVGWSHKMQYFTCNKDGPCPWEIFPIYIGGISIPSSELSNWIVEAKKIHQAYHKFLGKVCFPLNGIYFRFAQASDAHIALNEGKETVFIDVEYSLNPWNLKTEDGVHQVNAVAQNYHVYQELVQMSLRKFNARPHWGKNTETAFLNIGKDQFNKWDKFLASKSKFDPDNIFTNDFWKRVEGTSKDKEILTDECGIKGTCFCENDSHCKNGLKCQDGLGFPEIKVCRL